MIVCLRQLFTCHFFNTVSNCSLFLNLVSVLNLISNPYFATVTSLAGHKLRSIMSDV